MSDSHKRMFRFVSKTHVAASTNSNQTKTVPSSKINFIESFRPMYVFSRFFGMLPFTIECDTNGDIQKARVKTWDFIWFGIKIAMHLFAEWMYLTLLFSNSENVLVSINSLIEIVQITSLPLMVVMDMYNRSKFVDILKRLSRFDKLVCIKKSICSSF